MNLLIGVGSLAAAAILFSWAFELTRRPDSPGWLQHEGVTGAVALVCTMAFPLGAGFLIIGLLDVNSELRELGVFGTAAVLAISAGGVWVTHRIIQKARRGPHIRSDLAGSAAKPATEPA